MDPTARGLQGHVDEALTEWVLDERQPFVIVHSPGLRKVFKRLNPKYRTPHRTTIRNRVLPYSLCNFLSIGSCKLIIVTETLTAYSSQVVQLHATRNQMIKEYFESDPALHHCILADAWKDDAGRHWLGTPTFSFNTLPLTYVLGVSTQFATDDLRIFAPSLGLRQILDRHTSENIAEMIKDIVIKEWEILPSLMVSDNASNALGSSERVVDFVDEMMGSSLFLFLLLRFFMFLTGSVNRYNHR